MEKLEIDEIDIQIIQLLHKNPYITHNEIADHLDRSQPTVGLRIKKLINSGLISRQFGLNVDKIENIQVVKVQMKHKNPQKLFDLQSVCPYLIHLFRQSGEYNLMLFIACTSLKQIDFIIDYHMRNQSDISEIEVEILTGFSDNFIVPIDIRAITQKDHGLCPVGKNCPCSYID